MNAQCDISVLTLAPFSYPEGSLSHCHACSMYALRIVYKLMYTVWLLSKLPLYSVIFRKHFHKYIVFALKTLCSHVTQLKHNAFLTFQIILHEICGDQQKETPGKNVGKNLYLQDRQIVF